MNKKADFYVVLDNIRSLENIGSMFRTADAFKVDKIFLCGISGTPPHPKISKTALGAETWIPWEYSSRVGRLLDALKKENVQILCLEQKRDSVPLEKFRPKFPIALVVGNEVRGVSKSVLRKADSIVHIPMFGKKESLNVAVAFGIAAYKLHQYRAP